MTYIGFPTLSLIYMVIFLALYYSKRRIGLFENRIVIALMIINSIGLILELGCYLVMAFLKIEDTFLGILILKSYVAYIPIFNWILTGYIFVITNKNYGKTGYNMENYFYKVLLSFLPITFILVLITYIVPLHYSNVYPKYYTYGIATNFILYSMIILLPTWISRCIISIFGNKNKQINSKIYLLLLGIILIGSSGALTQIIDKSILIITSAETVMLALIYFTIENPDMKMLDEVYHAKEISDNSNEEKTLFIYNMTNEIRQITRDVDGSCDNILNETDNKKVNMEIINDNVRDIKGSMAKFSVMTNQILDISEMDINRIKIYNKKYNIKLMLKELIQVYKNKCNNNDIELRSIIETDIPEYLYGDSVNLRKVLITLLDNSVKNTSKGFIELNVSTIIKRDICRLVITVEDSGNGINPHDLNRVLNNKNEREDISNLSDTLYNAKKLITLMGGTIVPSSIVNVGTKIKIILDQRIVNIASETTKYANIYDKKRIIIVDDSEASIKLFKKLLDNENIILQTVSNGKQLLDKIRNKEKFDLILLDEEMKPQNAYVIMEKLKTIRSFNSKVILLTKNNNHEYTDDYKKYGFSNYLLKPIDKKKLFMIVNE